MTVSQNINYILTQLNHFYSSKYFTLNVLTSVYKLPYYVITERMKNEIYNK